MGAPWSAAWIVPLAVGLIVPSAWADVTLHQRVTLQFAGDRTETQRKVIFYAKGRRARFEGDAWRRKPTIIQFDRGLILRLDPRKKTFTKVALKDLGNVLKDADNIIRGVDELMSRKKAHTRRRYRLKPVDVRVRVNGFLSRVYVARRDNHDKVRAKVWVTQESDAGKEVYAIQREIANVAANLLLPMDPRLLDELQRVGGTAVRILLLGKTGAFGPTQTDIVVEKIDRRPLDESFFDVPDGYSEDLDLRDPMPDGMRRNPSALELRLRALQKLFQ
ncbi:MAG: hypothetical protein ACE5JS_22290 [Nitrospinota bacterium]